MYFEYFGYLGLLVTLFYTVQLGRWIYRYFFWSANLEVYRSHPQEIPWVVITGAACGLGFSFAKELALKRFHVLLMDILHDGLEAAKTNIERELSRAGRTDVHVDTLICDASDSSEANILKVRHALKNRPLALLINNVGLSTPMGGFDEQKISDIHYMLSVNVMYTTLLINSLIPLLKFRHRSCIINVSSASQFVYLPYILAYAASKKYVSGLSELLSVELSKYNIDILSVNPLRIAGLKNKKRPSWYVLTPEQVVKGTLKKLRCDTTNIVPSVFNSLAVKALLLLYNYAPRRCTEYFIYRITEMWKKDLPQPQ